ncbi:hypothetical protein RJ640_030026 [Escallonia rubra]|uniref:Prohibitin n=1 Tax=Escallonia rubra TaxID=112253 RepID=A0AA88RXM8_9ASTE|nr:hypothetical protein RJ640_030026 [Escallonia rubra]
MVGLRILARPLSDQLPTVYRTLGANYDDRFLPSVMQETMMAVTLSTEIRRVLTDRAATFNIAVDDVSIISLTFGKEFTDAIEAKQIAAQEAEKAKFAVEKAKFIGMKLFDHQGEAKVAQLIGQAISKK